MAATRYRWVRVTKRDRCRVCGKPDFCTYAPEVGLALCMRVESDRPSRNALGGWLHRTGEPTAAPERRAAPAERPPQDFGRLWKGWFDATDIYHLDGFAMSLGVRTDSLRSVGCAWTGREWAFPMKDEAGRIIGIRLRDERGRKWAVRGSRNGLFVPDSAPRGVLWVVEGPTDAAAALTIGLDVIGRPSCSACDEMVARYVRRQKSRRVVIITDNDRPDSRGVVAGVRGAEKLRKALPATNCVYVPPTKDLREFVNRGGDRLLLESALKDLVWQHPTTAPS
ncbi:MAG TPA: toprim domain-containing protein [Pyrinomonadaceae bacterium]|nr:toprim domain-containing protein [Pyrinomonadaceae bacterium]